MDQQQEDSISNTKIELTSTIQDTVVTLTDQQKVDNAVELLQVFDEKNIKFESTNQKIEKLTDAIKNLKEYKDAVAQVILKENKFVFKKSDGIILDSNILLKEYEAITVEGTFQSGSKEKIFSFTVYILYTNKINTDSAVMKIKTIKNEVIELESIDLNVAKLKVAIKNLQKYKTAMKLVTLKEDNLTFERTSGISLEDSDSVKNNDIILVKGIVKSKTVEKDFTFTIKVKEKLTDQQKVDLTVESLNEIKSITVRVELIETDLNIAKIKAAILKLKEYKKAFRDEVVLKPESIVLENRSSEVLSDDDIINDEDIITVKVIVQAGNEKEKFAFTIQIKEINEENNVINNAIITLESMEKK